ncbi:MAG: general stress protein [Bryobacterales bacterium]
MENQNTAVGVFGKHEDAEQAVKTLSRSGVDMRQLSIVGRDYHTDEHVTGYYNTGDRVKYWGKNGAFWGAIFGWLFGAAFFVVPGIGPLVIAGPLGAAFVAALEGAFVVGGLSALGASLYSLGIPKDSVLSYEAALKADKYLLLVHGTPEEVERAKDILSSETAVERADVHVPVHA